MEQPLPFSGNVLVVEDHEATRRAVVKALRRWGYEPHQATSVAEAQQRVTDRKFDVIICDGILGDGLGLEFVHALREKKDLTPVVFTSACVTPPLPWEREFAVLPKPFDLVALRAVLERVTHHDAPTQAESDAGFCDRGRHS